MKDSRPGSNGRRRRSSDDFSGRSQSRSRSRSRSRPRSPSRAAETSRNKSSTGGDGKARRGGGSDASSAGSRPSSKSNSREPSRSPSRSSRHSDGSVSPPATVTPPRGSPRDARSPKKRSSRPGTPDAQRAKSPRPGEEKARKAKRPEGSSAAAAAGGADSPGHSRSSVVEVALSSRDGPVAESGGLGAETAAVHPSEAAAGVGRTATPVRRTPSPRPEKTDKAPPPRLTPLTPSPESSKSEGATAEDVSEELAGERVLGDSSGSGGGGSVVTDEASAAAVAAPATANACGMQSDDGPVVAVELDGASNDTSMDVEMRTAGAAAADTATGTPSPQAGDAAAAAAATAAAVAAALRPPAAVPSLQEKSGVVTPAHEPTPASGSVGQAREGVSGKKRPRPIKTGGPSPPKASGPLPPGGSLPAQAPAPAAGRPLTPNGKRSPASGKTGGKDKARGRGGSEKKGRAGGSGGGSGGTSTGITPAPQARRTPRAAAVVAAGKIKSTSEGGGGVLAAGAGSGLLGGGGGGLSAFQSYGPGGPTADDSEEEATLEGLSPPNHGVSPQSKSGSKPMDPHQWFCAKTKVAEMIALDRHKVYTSSPEQSIGKGKEYKSYLAMVQTPIWLQKIQNKIAGRKMDCRWVGRWGWLVGVCVFDEGVFFFSFRSSTVCCKSALML